MPNLTHTGQQLDDAINKVLTTYKDTTGTDANAGDILKGKKAVTSAGLVTGAVTIQNLDIIGDEIKYTMEASGWGRLRPFGGYYADVTISKPTSCIPENVKVNETIMGIKGNYTSDGTITADKVANGYIGYANGQRIVGQASLLNIYKSGTTMVPAVLTMDTYECSLSVSNLPFRPKVVLADVQINGRPHGSNKLIQVDFDGFSYMNYLTDGEVLRYLSGNSITNNGFSWGVVSYLNQIDGIGVRWTALG